MQAARGHEGSARRNMNSRVKRRARSPPAAPRSARRWPRAPRARAGCAAHRWDGYAPRRPASTSARRACMRGPAQPSRVGIEAARMAVAGPRQRRDAADQCAQVQHRAAHQQRHASARFDVVDGLRGIAHELPRRVTRAGLDQVDEVMRHLPRAPRVRLGAADVEAAIHLRRIDADDLDRETRAPARSAKLALARARRAGQHRDRSARCGTSAPAQEHAIELLQRHLRPGRTAVIALIGARRLLHLPQQRVHLRQRQAAMRVDGRTAGDGA